MSSPGRARTVRRPDRSLPLGYVLDRSGLINAAAGVAVIRSRRVDLTELAGWCAPGELDDELGSIGQVELAEDV